MRIPALALAAAMSLLSVRESDASVVGTLAEVGGDLVFSISGNIDLSGLTPFGSGSGGFTFADMAASPFVPQFTFSTSGSNYNRYALSSVATNFMTSSVSASSFTSNIDAFEVFSEIRLPSSYVSGDPITASMTFNGRTLASISAVPGDHVWTLPNGQTVTLEVVLPAPSTAVPLPLPAGLLLAGLGALGLASRRRSAGPDRA